VLAAVSLPEALSLAPHVVQALATLEFLHGAEGLGFMFLTNVDTP
jgi:hypothetical protein